MRMNPRALALSLVLVAGAASPVLAVTQPMNQSNLPQRQQAFMNANPDAFVTTVPPLTYSVQDDRRAAVTYLDDAIGLIDLSRTQLANGHADMARVALMGASGKLTTAYLLNFRDRDFSQRIEPVAMRVQDDLNSLQGDNRTAMSNLDSLRGQVASIGQQQLAMLPRGVAGGGGGGGGTIGTWEPLNNLAGETPGTNLNVPAPEEID